MLVEEDAHSLCSKVLHVLLLIISEKSDEATFPLNDPMSLDSGQWREINCIDTDGDFIVAGGRDRRLTIWKCSNRRSTNRGEKAKAEFKIVSAFPGGIFLESSHP